jgi:hypothetical protein
MGLRNLALGIPGEGGGGREEKNIGNKAEEETSIKKRVSR